MVYFLLSLSLTAFAGKQEHKSHSHEAGEVSIAFEGTKGKLFLDSSGDTIYGFEHPAKNKIDQKRQKEALDKLEANISTMISFEKKLNCLFSKEKIGIAEASGHSDVEASFAIVCNQDPTGSMLTFNFQKVFPALKEVIVQLLIGDIQKSVNANKNDLQVKLTK